MDAFFPREDEEPQALTIDGLVSILLERLNVHTFFSFTYRAAITVALISGEANIIGQYIDEEFSIKLDLEEGTVVLSHSGEELETYQIDKADFEEYLETLRQEIAAPTSKVYTPETLADALVDSIWEETDAVHNVVSRERLIQSYLSSVTVAAVHGDCRVASANDDRLDLVIHPTRPTATLCQGDEIIDAFKLDVDAFQALRDLYANLAIGETEDAE